MKCINVLIATLVFAVACSGSPQSGDTAVTDDNAIADTTVSADAGDVQPGDSGRDAVADVRDALADGGADAGADVTGDLPADEGAGTDVAMDAVLDADGQILEIADDAVTDIPGDSGLPDVAADVVSDAPEADGACVNDDDLAIVSGDIASVRTSSLTCYLNCGSLPDMESCRADCIMTTTGISSSCAACFDAGTECMVVNCMMPCMADSQSQECLGCQEDTGCFTAFAACSGL